MEQIPFISSAPNTLGIELELQLIDPRSLTLPQPLTSCWPRWPTTPSPTASNRKSRAR